VGTESIEYAPIEGAFWLDSGVIQFMSDALLCEGMITDETNGIWCRNENRDVICTAVWECYDGDCFTTAGQQYARAFVFTVVALIWGVLAVGGAAALYSGTQWIKRMSTIDTVKTAVVLQVALSLFHIWTPLNYHALGNVLSGIIVLISTSSHQKAPIVFVVALATFFSNGGWNNLVGVDITLGYENAFYERLARSFNSNECFVRYAVALNDWRCNTLILIGMWGSWMILIFQFVYMFWAGWVMSGNITSFAPPKSQDGDEYILLDQFSKTHLGDGDVVELSEHDSISGKEEEMFLCIL